MGDACGKLTEGGEFFPHDDLVLGLLELGQDTFQFFVLVLKLVGQLFDFVESDSFQGMATENFEGGGHVGHFILALDFYLSLEVALGHAPHPAREQAYSTHEDPADKQPDDEQCTDNAETTNNQEQSSAGEDRLG